MAGRKLTYNIYDEVAYYMPTNTCNTYANTRKPWDVLRAPAKKPPIVKGTWKTHCNAVVRVDDIDTANVRLTIGEVGNYFGGKCLRELAEFCTELADQIEGK